MEFLEGEEARLIKLNNGELLDEFEKIVNSQMFFIHKTLSSREKEGKIIKGDIDRYKNIWINFQIKLLETLRE